MFEQREDLVGGSARFGMLQDEAAGLKGETGQGGAADVILGRTHRLGDGPGQGRFVARPHAVGVVAQRGGLLHQAREVGEPRVGGVDGELGLFQQEVLAQRLRDRLARGRSRTAATSSASSSSS